MCGIFGLWNRTGAAIDLDRLARATARLRHRGPDDEGYMLLAPAAARAELFRGSESASELPHLQQAAGKPYELGFGFRRLAILDRTPAGRQPMLSPDGRFCLVYNGEVYNYRELRAELRERGDCFRGESDSEVILAAYAAWGPACLQRFNGMWALAIWDLQTHSLFLARDRLGIKPLYLCQQGALFSFASEIKALLGPGGMPFRPSAEAIYRYLAAGILPSPQAGASFFSGIQALPPAHSLLVERERISMQRYWQLPSSAAAAPPEDPELAAAQFAELFRSAITLHLRSDVPIGSCLSGGIDSSAIVCTISRMLQDEGLERTQIGERQRTFSAIYAQPGRHDERQPISLVLQASDAQAAFVQPDATRLLAEAAQLIWQQDEPFQSTSVFAQWCVMALARSHGISVLLDGQGADEMLAGYRPFGLYLADTLRNHGTGPALRALQAIALAGGGMPARLALQTLSWLLPQAPLDQLRARRARHAASLNTLQADFVAHTGKQTIADWWPRAAQASLDRHLRHQLLEASLPHLLRYEDRNSMAFGIEARVPFLDYRLVELAFGALAPYRIHNGWTKWPLRQAMAAVLPAPIRWRRDKVGFETPQVQWMAAWHQPAQELFGADAASSAYLNTRLIREQIASGNADAGMLWRWINLELWLRIYRSN